MDDLDEILEALTIAWTAMAAKVATIWVPIQLAIIALAALAGWGLAVLVRKRVDFAKLTAAWPVYLRIAALTAAKNLGIIAAIVLLMSIYAAMRAATVPSRFYLIGVASNLATAWVDPGERHPKPAVQPSGVDRSVVDRGTQHCRPARSGAGRA